jgi:hypothetical protein
VFLDLHSRSAQQATGLLRYSATPPCCLSRVCIATGPTSDHPPLRFCHGVHSCPRHRPPIHASCSSPHSPSASLLLPRPTPSFSSSSPSSAYHSRLHHDSSPRRPPGLIRLPLTPPSACHSRLHRASSLRRPSKLALAEQEDVALKTCML